MPGFDPHSAAERRMRRDMLINLVMLAIVIGVFFLLPFLLHGR
jgi:predicted secreted protein